uniref:Uncharacterized protein n=1 Tax=Arundo donax TaxID=35708 RepID=A0A0A9EN45_ARUDO
MSTSHIQTYRTASMMQSNLVGITLP